MASAVTVAFLGLLTLKHVVIDVFLTGTSFETRDTVSPAPLGYVSIPNELLVHFYQIDLPDGITDRDDDAFVMAVNSCLAVEDKID